MGCTKKGMDFVEFNFDVSFHLSGKGTSFVKKLVIYHDDLVLIILIAFDNVYTS